MVYKDRIREIHTRLLDSVAPCVCQICGRKSGRSLSLCQACEDEIPLNYLACERCALPLVEAFDECGRCQRRPPPQLRALVPRLYQSPVDEFVRDLKFRRRTFLVPVLAQLMAPAIADSLWDRPLPDLVVPVPMHWWRRWRRGFNQAEMLAQALVRSPELVSLGLKVNTGICRRRQGGPPQAGLDAKQRSRMGDVFQCRSTLEGLRIAIVDDVVTTGATSARLAQTLIDAGAMEVEVWACARTPG